MSNTERQNEITTEQAIALCSEIYPNLTWEIGTHYHPRHSHGKLYGTLPELNQFLDVTILIGGAAVVSLILGNHKGYNGQVILKRGDFCQLGQVDPLYDLGSYLRGFQRHLITQARLQLIFAAYTHMSYVLEPKSGLVMWQHQGNPEEGMIEPVAIAQEDLDCPHCGHPHSDLDEWAIKPHQTHLCLCCGEEFEGTLKAVSRPQFVRMITPENVTYEIQD